MYPQYQMQTTKKTHVIGVTGPTMGSSKSGTLSLLAYWFYKAGYTVYSNCDLAFPHRDFWELYNNIQQLFKLKHIVIVLDDANNLPGFESRKATDPLNIMISHLAQQSRRRDFFFIFSAPKLIWVDVRLWDLAVIHIYTDHFAINGKEVVMWDILDKRFPVGDPRRHYKRWLDPTKYYNLYNTYEKVTPLALAQRPNMGGAPQYGKPIPSPVRVCPGCNTSSRLNFNRKEMIQYCSKCGWEREIEPRAKAR